MLFIQIMSLGDSIKYSDIQTDAFVKLPAVSMAYKAITSMLHFPEALSHQLWATLDQVIESQECQIYQFLPEKGMEPDSEGNLSSLYLFFFNRKLKRVVFFTGRVVRLIHFM